MKWDSFSMLNKLVVEEMNMMWDMIWEYVGYIYSMFLHSWFGKHVFLFFVKVPNQAIQIGTQS